MGRDKSSKKERMADWMYMVNEVDATLKKMVKYNASPQEMRACIKSLRAMLTAHCRVLSQITGGDWYDYDY